MAPFGVVCKTIGTVTDVCPATGTKLGRCRSQRVIGFAGHGRRQSAPAEYARPAIARMHLGLRADRPVLSAPSDPWSLGDQGSLIYLRRGSNADSGGGARSGLS